MTTQHATEIKAGITAFFAFLTALWGWFGWVVVVWIALLALDWITGSAAAIKSGTWSSKRAREGAWHKLGSIIAVLVACLLDVLFGLLLDNVPLEMPFTYTVLLCPLVIIWYILTEAGSIVENAGTLGAPIPPWLKKAIAAFKDKLDENGNSSVYDSHNNVTDVLDGGNAKSP